MDSENFYNQLGEIVCQIKIHDFLNDDSSEDDFSYEAFSTLGDLSIEFPAYFEEDYNFNELSQMYYFLNAILYHKDEKLCLEWLDAAIYDQLTDVPLILYTPELKKWEKGVEKLLKKNREYIEY